MGDPKVSVITGFYNRRPAVRKSIQSILSQSFEDFELIAFDDASTDGTASELKKFSDPRLRVIENTKNQGFVSSLINAIDSSNGAYIAIHGAGDISYPDRLAQQVAFLDGKPMYAAVGCHRDILDPSGRIVSKTRPRAASISFQHLLRQNVYSHGEVMYRRESYYEAGGYRSFMQFSQDYDLWLRMAAIGQLGVIQKVLYGRVAFRDGASFDPKKVTRQAAFTSFARRSAQCFYSNENSLIRSIELHGILSVIPPTDLEVLTALRRRLRVLIALGRWDDFHELDQEIHGGTMDASFETNILRAINRICRRIDPNGTTISRMLSLLKSWS